MKEIWKPVLGFEGLYEVSNLGRARSLARSCTFTNRWGGKTTRFFESVLLSVGKRKDGYLNVSFYRNGEADVQTVHRAVCEAFIGPRPHGMEILHADDDKSNNHLTNLSYGTKAENEQQKVDRGRSRRGERAAGAASAKLTVSDVREIRQRRGEPQEDLALEFGCTFSNISAIQLRKSWRHVR